MINNVVWLLNKVREDILDAFIIPDLNISYWDFCILLLIVGLVATVLVNSAKGISGRAASSEKIRSSRSKKNKGSKNSNGSNYGGLTASEYDELVKINRGY